MNDFVHPHKRREADLWTPKKIAAIAAPWLVIFTLLGILGAGAIKYTRLVDTVDKMPELEKRVESIERFSAVSEAQNYERNQTILQRLSRIESKIDLVLR